VRVMYVLQGPGESKAHMGSDNKLDSIIKLSFFSFFLATIHHQNLTTKHQTQQRAPRNHEPKPTWIHSGTTAASFARLIALAPTTPSPNASWPTTQDFDFWGTARRRGGRASDAPAAGVARVRGWACVCVFSEMWCCSRVEDVHATTGWHTPDTPLHHIRPPQRFTHPWRISRQRPPRRRPAGAA
jgi:hypothetical protein